MDKTNLIMAVLLVVLCAGLILTLFFINKDLQIREKNMYNDLEYAPSEKYMEICENYYDTRTCYNIVSKYMQIKILKKILNED